MSEARAQAEEGASSADDDSDIEVVMVVRAQPIENELGLEECQIMYKLLGEAAKVLSGGDFERAAEFFESATELNPDLSLSYAKCGDYCLKNRKYGPAVLFFSKALALNPEFGPGYKYRGKSYRMMGKFQAAREDLLKAYQFNPENVLLEWLQEVDLKLWKSEQMKKAEGAAGVSGQKKDKAKTAGAEYQVDDKEEDDDSSDEVQFIGEFPRKDK